MWPTHEQGRNGVGEALDYLVRKALEGPVVGTTQDRVATQAYMTTLPFCHLPNLQARRWTSRSARLKTPSRDNLCCHMTRMT